MDLTIQNIVIIALAIIAITASFKRSVVIHNEIKYPTITNYEKQEDIDEED